MRWLIDEEDGTFRELSIEEASKMLNDIKIKRVARDTVGPLDISTVWLGLDHRWDEGSPLIYETMIFSDGSYCDHHMERYSYRKDAEARHEVIVEAAMEWVAGSISDRDFAEVLENG